MNLESRILNCYQFHCAGLIGLGPYPVPATFEINFCPSANGQLALLWHGSIPNQVMGRKAWVVRTTVDQRMRPPLLTVDDIGATGMLGCEVVASSRSIAIFDNGDDSGARGTADALSWRQ